MPVKALMVLVISASACFAQSESTRCIDLLSMILRESSVPAEIDLSTRPLDDQARSYLSEAIGSDICHVTPAVLTDPVVRESLKTSKARIIMSGSTWADVDEALSPKISRLHIMAAFPTNQAGVTATFDEVPLSLRSADTYLQSAALRFRELQDVPEIAGRVQTSVLDATKAETKISDQLLENIRGSLDEQYLVIVAHNDGEVLKLADGSTLPFGILQDELSQRPVKGIVLTCESIDFVRSGPDGGGLLPPGPLTTRRLEYDAMACALLEVLQAGFLDSSCTAVDTFLRKLDRALEQCEGRSGLRSAVVAVGVGVTIVTLVDLATNDGGKSRDAETDDEVPDE